MRRLLLAGLVAVGLVGCAQREEVPFEVMQNYFFRNDAEIPADARIADAASFEALFGTAAFMGKNGEPTPVDFEREFVIAVVAPVTDRATELVPVTLLQADGRLVFRYQQIVGAGQSWSMQPVLLVKVDRRYDAGAVELVRDLRESE